MATDVKATGGESPQIAAYRQAVQAAQDQLNQYNGSPQANSALNSPLSPVWQQQQGLQKAVQDAQDKLNNAITMGATGRNEDGSYIRPAWQSNLDDTTGLLKAPYVLGADFNGEPINTQGLDKYRTEAMRDAGAPSTWAKAQLAQNALKQTQDMNNMAATQNSGLAGTYDSMGATGGVNSGSREMMAQNSLRDLIRGRQSVRQAGNAANAQTMTQDEQNRITQLGNLPGMEIANGQYNLQNDQAKLQVQQTNINNALTERQAQRNDDMAAWQKNQDVWASNKQADAQRASSGGGGGCCFIFLEARYGNGTMDKVVRKFRDENMTLKNKRGYYKLSEVLVPLMRKSRVAKFLTRALLTDPLVQYGKYHYGENKHGWIFAPVKNFWLKAFDYLGDDHEFVRENGETV